MDITTLKGIIKAALTGTSFNLDISKLVSRNVNAIAADYLSGTMLCITPDPKTPIIEPSDGQSIIVQGTGIGSPFTGMTVQACFNIVNSQAALCITATATQNWSVGGSFPDLAETLVDTIPLDKTNLAHLILSSDAQNQLPAGLILKATFNFDSTTGYLPKLLNVTSAAVKGPIVLKNSASQVVSINITADPFPNVNLWIVKNCNVQFSMQNYTIVNPYSKQVSIVPYLTLSSTVPFTAQGKPNNIPISVTMLNFVDDFIFNAELDTSIPASINEVSALFNNASLASVIPSDLSIKDIPNISELYFSISQLGVLDAAGVALASSTTWKILHLDTTNKDLIAENLKLKFSILTPFTSPQPYIDILGDVLITDKAQFCVHASYPDFEINGYIPETSIFSVKDFIAYFVGPNNNAPDLLITELEVDIKPNDYSFNLLLDGAWAINDGINLALMVLETGFSCTDSSGDKTANFNGIISIANVSILITADYESSGGDSGWQFSGSTQAGETIPIGDFISYASYTFGVGTPPSWITGITLQDLQVDFNTSSKNFDFSVIGNIPVAQNDTMSIVVKFAMTEDSNADPKTYTKTLTGTITIANQLFELGFKTDKGDTSFSASWSTDDPSKYLEIESIAKDFGFTDLPEIPKNIDLGLKSAGIYYETEVGSETLVLHASSANYGNVVLVAQKTNSVWTYVLGIAMQFSNLDLTNLPLIGSDLASLGPIGIQSFTLLLANKAILPTAVPAINAIITAHAGSDYPQLPIIDGGIVPGAYIAIDLSLGTNNTYEVQVNTGGSSQSGLSLAQNTNANIGQDTSAYWINLQKNLGPVFFDKVGITYSDGEVLILLDASLVLGPLTISLNQLEAGTPLDKFQPSFDLAGLNISYQSGPVQISGGFFKETQGDTSIYNGEVIIALEEFNLSALGSYASINSHPSLFVFVMLSEPPLGGPPCFFVNGIVAGFGYNRSIKLPNINEVATFPLVQGFVPNQQSPFSGNDPGAALQVLVDQDIVPVSIGENWLAAGVQFSSFELVQSYALLVVEMGTNLEIGVMGLSTISVPPEDPAPLAFAEMALDAKILPDTGVVTVDAVLTSASYVLSKDCFLTGGFAFYLWTAPNANEGDFVVTLGGYNPAFVPPSYYPAVPRLGFNWVVNSDITVKGGMYFAITPTCLMAGGMLEALFQTGALEAWFTVGADFLIAWKPYHYEADMYISFGVSYTFSLDLLFTTVTVTISVSLGADLSIWGPDFAGTAHIHLWIISFDISFGDTQLAPPAAISWQEFTTTFLPANTNAKLQTTAFAKPNVVATDTYCLSKVIKGLLQDLSSKPDETDWLVNRNITKFQTNSVVPIKDYQIIITDSTGYIVPPANIIISNAHDLDNRNQDFGVGLVNVAHANFKSKHVITITYHSRLDPLIEYDVKAIISNVPKSLWENRTTGFDTDGTIQNVLVGFEIMPFPPIPDASVAIDMEDFSFQSKNYSPVVNSPTVAVIPAPDQQNPMEQLMSTINADPAKTMRSNIVASLNERGLNLNTEIDVVDIAAKGNDYLFAAPILDFAYWKKSA